MYGDADVDGLRQTLASADWNTLTLQSGTVHAAASSWTDSFLYTCRKFVPQQTVQINPRSKLWFSRHLQYLASCCDRLFKRSRGQSSNSQVMIAFRKVRNLFVSELREAERRYFASLGNMLMAPGINSQR